MASITLYTKPYGMILRGADQLNPKLEVIVGEKLTDNGNVSYAYAGVKVPGKPDSWESALILLAKLPENVNGKPVLHAVSWPKESGVTLRLSISPKMTGARIAVMFAYLAGLDPWKLLPLTTERIDAHAKALGIDVPERTPPVVVETPPVVVETPPVVVETPPVVVETPKTPKKK